MTAPDRARPLVARILREPVVHFVGIGAALFVLVQAFAPPPAAGPATNQIVVSEDDLRRLLSAWLAQSGQPPTPDVVRALVEADVREEVLAREAVQLGLDRGDPIVRRRLAQKMDFLAADIAAMQEPGEADLRSWYAANSARFTSPPRVSFHHLYFSSDRGVGARDDAAAALHSVATDPSDLAGADPFMFRDFYVEQTPEQAARAFGADFAASIFDLDPGTWSGPIRSGYGWHLVYVDAHAPGRIPAFEEVEPDVARAWLEDQQRTLRDKAYATMLARYEVIVPDLPVDAFALPAPEAPLSGAITQ